MEDKIKKKYMKYKIKYLNNAYKGGSAKTHQLTQELDEIFADSMTRFKLFEDNFEKLPDIYENEQPTISITYETQPKTKRTLLGKINYITPRFISSKIMVFKELINFTLVLFEIGGDIHNIMFQKSIAYLSDLFDEKYKDHIFACDEEKVKEKVEEKNFTLPIKFLKDCMMLLYYATIKFNDKTILCALLEQSKYIKEILNPDIVLSAKLTDDVKKYIKEYGEINKKIQDLIFAKIDRKSVV